MKYKHYLLLFLSTLTINHAFAENVPTVLEKSLSDYKTYSLARCITNNYKSMGVDFDKLHVIDSTLGFIDIEEGFGFSTEKNNPLDAYIKNNTQYFYKPKQNEGDLAKINLVIYDCVAFSQSKGLNDFLIKIISEERL